MCVGARVSESSPQEEVIGSRQETTLQRPLVDRFRVALGGDNETGGPIFENSHGVGDKLRIETIALENREMCAAALQHSLLNGFPIAAPRDRKNAHKFRELVMQAIAGIERAIFRAILTMIISAKTTPCGRF